MPEYGGAHAACAADVAEAEPVRSQVLPAEIQASLPINKPIKRDLGNDRLHG